MTTETIEVKALTAADQARAIVVVNLAHRVLAAEMGRTVAALDKQAEEFFEPMKKAAAATHREICAKENKVREPLKEAKAYLSRQIGTFDQEQERLRREEEARVQAEVEAAAVAEAKRLADEQAIQDAILLEAEGDKAGADAVLNHPTPVPVVIPPVVIQRQTVKTAGVSSSQRWLYKIEREDLIPREYLMVDAVKLGQVVRALKDKTSIPGIKAYPEGGARFRA